MKKLNLLSMIYFILLKLIIYKRIKNIMKFVVDITTIWGVGEDEDTEITDEITLTESNIIADFSLANGDLRKWKQFLLAKGCDYRLKNNPYIEE